MSATLSLEELAESTAEFQNQSFANQWRLIPVSNLTPKSQDIAHRLNGLGSSYYFGKIILRKHRLVEHLHKMMLDIIEQDYLKEVIEWPRGHFKTTCYSEIAPMWWALPFTTQDELYMRHLGYGDEFIRWMKKAHDQDTRTLLVSETADNAEKLGVRIDYHYENNKFFQDLYPEIKLTPQCKWTASSKTHLRSKTANAAQGEGTYDYIGVGGALQSRHYKRVVQDDLVGKEALKSEIVMKDTIAYHQLLPGAFDVGETQGRNDEIVVGNRWSYRDLNHHIKAVETNFNFQSHSAVGGCCPKHAPNKIIFPEEFTFRILEEFKRREGSYFFSCQYLNAPTPPGDTKFKQSYLNYFMFRTVSDYDKRVMIQHLVQEGGLVIKDIFPSSLARTMVVDPNHAGTEGRSRHAIIVTGFEKLPKAKVMLLDLYAENSSHADLVYNMYRVAEKWKIKRVHLETIAAQKWLKYHIEVMNELRKKDGKWTIEIIELKIDHSKDAKIHRIESLEPMFERGEFWCLKAGHEKFIQEYVEYPYSATRDILDVLGYAMTTWSIEELTDREKAALVAQNRQRFNNSHRSSMTGY